MRQVERVRLYLPASCRRELLREEDIMKNRYWILAFVLCLFALSLVPDTTLPNEGDVYTAGSIIEKTEYKDVRDEVLAILILETAWFAKGGDDVEKTTQKRIEYLREFDFPTTNKQGEFYKALKEVPNSIRKKPYATDKDYVQKVKNLKRRIANNG